MKVILLTGVPASGKTVLLKKISGFKKINFGDVMVEEARKLGIKVKRDKLRKDIEIGQYEILQEKAALVISKICKKENVVINTHLSIRHLEGIIEGIPENIAKLFNIKLIIIVESDPRDIIKRRKNSKIRRRDEETFDEIMEQQEINKKYAKKLSKKFGCSVKLIFNKEIKKAQQELIEIIKMV